MQSEQHGSIQYHTALVNLFQPLLHLNEHHQSSHDCLRNLVIHHSRQALVYLSRYKKMYTFVYQSPLQLFCIVHICDALVRYSPTDDMTSDIVRFCLESLQEAKTSYHIAGHLQKMFRLALARLRTPFPDDLEKLMGSSSRYGPEELLEAVARISYRPPIEQLLPNMEPKLGQDFVREWQKRADEQLIARPHLEPKEDNNKRIEINSLLNS